MRLLILWFTDEMLSPISNQTQNGQAQLKINFRSILELLWYFKLSYNPVRRRTDYHAEVSHSIPRHALMKFRNYVNNLKCPPKHGTSNIKLLNTHITYQSHYLSVHPVWSNPRHAGNLLVTTHSLYHRDFIIYKSTDRFHQRKHLHLLIPQRFS